jgi:hypothetical protein
MPCYEPSGPEIDLAYARADVERLETLLQTACEMLVTAGWGNLIDENTNLNHWWKLRTNTAHVRLARQIQQKLAEDALNKPFKDLSIEEKKALKDFGYL